MAITLDAVASFQNAATSTALTIGSGATILVVCSSTQDGNQGNCTVTSVTWDGVALTRGPFVQAVGNTHAEIWYLFNPTAGNLTLGFNTAGPVYEGVFMSSWFGTQTAGSLETTASNSGSSSGADVSLTSTTNNALFIDACSSEPVPTGYGTGQTALATALQAQSFENSSASYEIVAVAGTNSMTRSLSFGSSWAAAGVVIAEGGGAATPINNLSLLGAGA